MSSDSIHTNGFLNDHQQRRLLITARYIDRLLSDIEAILNASSSSSPFPKYVGDVSNVQRKVALDYLRRIREQLLSILNSQELDTPQPSISSIHAIRTILGFVDIAAEELKPKYMRGYGEVPDAAVPLLNGIAGELEQIADELNRYLAQGIGQDLQARLAKLESVSDEIGLLRTIERVVTAQGLIEFRASIATILQRLEERVFEIAFFGRVSSGKSSLLNHILGSSILPVGVNPITAVPARIGFAENPRLSVWFAQTGAKVFSPESLPEFVTEQRNPANAKHVTRIDLRLPSPNLREGFVLVDTPGLGSLATSGAAETKAYLPRCDLGMILIDAASTLTAEDLGTLQTLYEAAVPAFILLSKADLLARDDREQAIAYIEGQVSQELGLKLPVFPVSIIGQDAKLLDDWFQRELVPLCERHQELLKQSIKRKVSSLCEAVQIALRVRTEKAQRGKPRDQKTTEVDNELRLATGKIEEVRQACRKMVDQLPTLRDEVVRSAALTLLELWPTGNELESVVRSTLTQVTAEHTRAIYELIDQLRKVLEGVMVEAFASVDGGASHDQELSLALNELPTLEAGPISFKFRPKLLLAFGGAVARWRIEAALQEQLAAEIENALQTYSRVLQAWVDGAIEELKQEFKMRADWYRGQQQSPTETSPENLERIEQDLNELASWSEGSFPPTAAPVP